MKSTDTYIIFKEEGLKIGYGHFTSDNKNGFVDSYIPGFNIAFSSPSQEVASQRADAMIRHFFDFWIKNQGWKEFMLTIHKLGFRTDMHNLRMKELLNNKRPNNSKFSSPESEDFRRFFGDLNKVEGKCVEKELAY